VSVDVPGVLEAHHCDLGTATGVAYAWAGRAQDARRVLRMTARRAAAEDFPTALAITATYLAVVELEDGAAVDAQAAAQGALATAVELGLGEYRGVAPAYAIRAQTGLDPDAAVADALHAVDVVRRNATSLALAYVLTVAADALIERDHACGRQLLAEARGLVDRCPDPGVVGPRLRRAESRYGVIGAAAAARGGAASALVEPLTERELAVLRYLPTQLTQRDIAAELFVSLNTVKTHCQAAYRKLGVVDRKAAVQAARQRRLL